MFIVFPTLGFPAGNRNYKFNEHQPRINIYKSYRHFSRRGIELAPLASKPGRSRAVNSFTIMSYKNHRVTAEIAGKEGADSRYSAFDNRNVEL